MKILIISGGRFEEEVAKEYLKKHSFDYTIAVDGGIAYASMLGMTPDLLLGDFDTIDKNTLEEYRQKKIEMLEFPPKKDYTDTHLALITALDKKPESITILSGTGTRMDHTLANIGLLTLAVEQKVPVEMIDANNRIRMIDDQLILEKCEQRKTYISLLPYTEKVTGITLTGFQYPLENAELTIGISRGISNELVEKQGMISMKQGKLLVIESWD